MTAVVVRLIDCDRWREWGAATTKSHCALISQTTEETRRWRGDRGANRGHEVAEIFDRFRREPSGTRIAVFDVLSYPQRPALETTLRRISQTTRTVPITTGKRKGTERSLPSSVPLPSPSARTLVHIHTYIYVK